MRLPAALSLLGLFLLAPAAPAEVEKPNVVFIYADDWGWGNLSCRGTDWLDTQNLDRLASEGADFLQFNVLNPIPATYRAPIASRKIKTSKET